MYILDWRYMAMRDIYEVRQKKSKLRASTFGVQIGTDLPILDTLILTNAI